MTELSSSVNVTWAAPSSFGQSCNTSSGSVYRVQIDGGQPVYTQSTYAVFSSLMAGAHNWSVALVIQRNAYPSVVGSEASGTFFVCLPTVWTSYCFNWNRHLVVLFWSLQKIIKRMSSTMLLFSGLLGIWATLVATKIFLTHWYCHQYRNNQEQ